MYISVGQAAEVIGVSISTLRRWEDEESFKPDFRTKGGHRRYDLSRIEQEFLNKNKSNDQRKVVAYARVSSHDQKNYLINKKFVFKHGKKYELPDGKVLIACYHPSPRNVNTKVINYKMMKNLFIKATQIG